MCADVRRFRRFGTWRGEDFNTQPGVRTLRHTEGSVNSRVVAQVGKYTGRINERPDELNGLRPGLPNLLHADDPYLIDAVSDCP